MVKFADIKDMNLSVVSLIPALMQLLGGLGLAGFELWVKFNISSTDLL